LSYLTGVTADRRATPHAHHLRVQRTARYYTLGEGFAPRTVWLVLHGYGQLASAVIQFFSDLADRESLVVAPEALNRFYLVSPESAPARERPVGATWMTREDRASEISDYVEYLDAVYEEVAAGHARDGAQVNVIGFSQGTATATRWVTHGRSHLNRLILWGGLLPPETDLSRGAASLRGARLTLVAGTRDEYVTDAVLAAEQARLDAARIRYDVLRFDGGHVVSRSAFPKLRAEAGEAAGPRPTGASDR
jgi:predicted esterase